MKARLARALLCLVALSAFLLGCNSAPEATPLSVVAETATGRTIEHTFGTTEVPTDPQRVLALGEEGLLADLLDAGIRPVASIVNVPDDVPLIEASELAGVELISSSAQVSLETLLAFDPDLIVGTVFFVNEVGYERLATIAPTVAVDGRDPLGAYAETMTVLGRGDEAEQQVADFRAQVAAEAERIGAASRRVSVATVYPGPNVALWFDGPLPAPLLLREMGVTLLPAEGEREGLDQRNGRAFISQERLDLLAGDPLLLLQSLSVEGEAEAVAAMEANPLWQPLPAVQAGNVVTLDRIGYPGFRGQRALLADLVAALE